MQQLRFVIRHQLLLRLEAAVQGRNQGKNKLYRPKALLQQLLLYVYTFILNANKMKFRVQIK